MRDLQKLIFVLLLFFTVVQSQQFSTSSVDIFDDNTQYPEEWSDFIDFYNKYHIIFMSAFVIFGLIECFLGFMSIKSIFLVVGFLLGFSITLLISSLLISSETVSNMKYLILAVEICVGLLIGCLMVSVLSIGKFIFGAACGALFSLYFYGIITSVIEVHTLWGFGYLMITFALLFGVLPFFFEQICLYLFTSFIGSVVIIFGISQFLGYWPNPLSSSFYNFIKSRQIPWEWYLYCGLFLLFVVSGFTFQLLTCREKYKESTESYVMKKQNRTNQYLISKST